MNNNNERRGLLITRDWVMPRSTSHSARPLVVSALKTDLTFREEEEEENEENIGV